MCRRPDGFISVCYRRLVVDSFLSLLQQREELYSCPRLPSPAPNAAPPRTTPPPSATRCRGSNTCTRGEPGAAGRRQRLLDGSGGEKVQMLVVFSPAAVVTTLDGSNSRGQTRCCNSCALVGNAAVIWSVCWPSSAHSACVEPLTSGSSGKGYRVKGLGSSSRCLSALIGRDGYTYKYT